MMYQNSYSYSIAMTYSKVLAKRCIVCTHVDVGNIAVNTMYSTYSLQEGERCSVSS